MEKGRDVKGGDRPVKICTRKARHAWPWPLEIEIPVGWRWQREEEQQG
jgi:uncharacterized protein YbdZ (MbtH family)